jgi:hypothetical protein
LKLTGAPKSSSILEIPVFKKKTENYLKAHNRFDPDQIKYNSTSLYGYINEIIPYEGRTPFDRIVQEFIESGNLTKKRKPKFKSS